MNNNRPDQDSINLSTAAYILPVGFIVTYLITRYFNLRNYFTVFHLRQSFGANILFIIFWFIFKAFNLWILLQLTTVIYALSIIYAIIGVREAKRLYLPFTGKLFDRLFTFI